MVCSDQCAALCVCILQLQTIPYEKPWYEMEKDTRNETVRRVHDVLFSQVMAIIHSMMELGCQQRQTREFLYRMCVVHQLTEGQRQQLLAMVLKRWASSFLYRSLLPPCLVGSHIFHIILELWGLEPMCFNPCAFLVESAVSPTRRFVALRCVRPRSGWRVVLFVL